MEIRALAPGLQVPEGPGALDDGTVLVVEIARGTLTEVSGRGTVWSWVVIHRPYFPGAEVPYRVAIVERHREPVGGRAGDARRRDQPGQGERFLLDRRQDGHRLVEHADIAYSLFHEAR